MWSAKWVVNTSRRSIRWGFRGNSSGSGEQRQGYRAGATLYEGESLWFPGKIKEENPLSWEDSPPRYLWHPLCFQLSQPILWVKIVFHVSSLCCCTSSGCPYLRIREWRSVLLRWTFSVWTRCSQITFALKRQGDLKCSPIGLKRYNWFKSFIQCSQFGDWFLLGIWFSTCNKE